MEQYKMNINLLEEKNTKLEKALEDEAKIVGSKYEEELKYLQAEVEAEQDAHAQTKAMLQSKDEELNHMLASLHAKNDEEAELQNQLDIYKEIVAQKDEATLKMEQKREEEVTKLKKRHVDELKNVQSQVELEQKAHAKTRQQFSEFRQTAQETFEKKLAELRDTFSTKERRMTIDIDSREEQIMKLQAENESLLQKQKRMQEELEDVSKENEIFRSTKAQDDRALVELLGHNNHKQKVSYIEKMRLENYNLKIRVMELEKEAARHQALSARTRKDSNGTGPASRTRSSRENLH
ncbi:hypothetical protein ANCDUO_23096 [Ancylostoma duodenale]|uniref:Uncharacterized protein n=1 Tax=Ancylostoma duodenale TaxID=51022 RepID=A0A0C2FJF0_9BILA|nr:hypothetical protein ANCDUO_23096 [Ancylostoma duodenale]